MAEYNGWTNWETWLINLHYEEHLRELVGDYEITTGMDLKYQFTEIMESGLSSDNMFVSDVLNGFIGIVNWWELLRHYQDENSNDETDEE
jgi:hypothetical protein